MTEILSRNSLDSYYGVSKIQHKVKVEKLLSKYRIDSSGYLYGFVRPGVPHKRFTQLYNLKFLRETKDYSGLFEVKVDLSLIKSPYGHGGILCPSKNLEPVKKLDNVRRRY